jgi:hypothetical protein
MAQTRLGPTNSSPTAISFGIEQRRTHGGKKTGQMPAYVYQRSVDEKHLLLRCICVIVPLRRLDARK